MIEPTPQSFSSITFEKKNKLETPNIQSQKTQGFCVADFFCNAISDERRSRSKIFLLFIWIKEPCVGKFEGLAGFETACYFAN